MNAAIICDDPATFAIEHGLELWTGRCDRCGTGINRVRPPEADALGPDLCRSCPAGAVRYLCAYSPQPRQEWGLVGFCGRIGSEWA